MITIKKIISVIFVSLFLLVNSYAEIKDSLFATVGDKAITRSDIVNEIKTILILNGQAFSESKRSEIEESAVQSIIRRTVKEIAVEKYNKLEFSKIDLENELKTLAANVNMDIETLKNTFTANEVNWSDVMNQIKTELLWNSLIFNLYKNRININQSEIEDQLELIQKNKFMEEYLISEIIVPLVSKEDLESKIKEINKRIVDEGFKNVARDISISETALNGGDLGWVNENAISSEFKKKNNEYRDWKYF